MFKKRRAYYLAGIVLLALAMLSGCNLFWKPPESSGWYIQLNVGDPGAKAIGVSEYDVTALTIAVYDPAISFSILSIGMLLKACSLTKFKSTRPARTESKSLTSERKTASWCKQMSQSSLISHPWSSR
jgi:hypothetical protein